MKFFKARFSNVFLGAAVIVALLFSMSPLRIAVDDSGAYRWRNDDGSETSATFAEDQDTPLTGLPKNTTTRLRMSAANPGDQSELLEIASLALRPAERSFSSAVIDTTNGFAYYATNDGAIIKVDVNPSNPFESVDGIVQSGANFLNAAVMDDNGYAYFATGQTPSTIIKVDIDPGRTFEIVGTLTLDAGENGSIGAVIDAPNGFAYFATGTDPVRLVKVDLGSFSRVDALTFASGEGNSSNSANAAVIDTANGFAYFGVQGANPGKIVKVDITPSNFVYLGSITLDSGENQPGSAVIDTANGFAYFGMQTSPARVVKVDISPSNFVRVSAVTLDSGEDSATNAVIDTDNNFAYFLMFGDSPAIVVKVDVNPSSFGRLDAVTFDSGENNATTVPGAAVIDTDNDFAYFGLNTNAGHIVKVDTDPGNFVRVAAANLIPDGESQLTAGVIDAANGYAYFGTGQSPAKIVKVELATLTRADVITLDSGESNLQSAVIDAANGYAYFGTSDSPGKVVKVDISPSNFSRIDAITFNGGEEKGFSAVIDTTNGFAYFGTDTSPGRVIKVDISPSNFSRVDAITFNGGENRARTAVIDAANGFAYFGTQTSPGRVVKVDVNPVNTFARVDAITMPGGGANMHASVIDPGNGYAYFTSTNTDSFLYRVDVNPANTFELVEDIALTFSVRSGVIDVANGFAYFGNNSQFDLEPATIAKVDINPSNSLSEVALAGPGGPTDRTAFVALMDDDGYTYWGMRHDGRITKYSIAPRAAFRLEYGEINGTCAAVSSWTQVGSGAWVMSNSSNLTDGEPTTDSPDITNPNDSFKAGEAKDTSSETSPISLGEREFTEIEYSIRATASATASATYCFRLTDAGSGSGLIDEVYPEVTLSATQPGAYRWRNDDGDETTASFAEDENVGIQGLARNTPKRLRFSADNTSDIPELSRVDALSFRPGINVPQSMVVDTTNGFAYMGTMNDNAVIKVDIDPGRTFIDPETIRLEPDEDQLWNAVIDEANGFAYFATMFSRKVIKVDINPANDFARVNAITLSAGGSIIDAAIDTSRGFAYFITDANPAEVVKVDIDPSRSFAEIGSIELDPDENNGVNSSVIDMANGYLYFGDGSGAPGKVVKIDVNHPAFARVDAVTLNVDEYGLTGAVIDTANGFAYFGARDDDLNQVIVVKLDIDPENTFARVDAVSFNSDEFILFDATIDTANGFAYFVYRGDVVKINVSPGDFMVEDSINLYAAGNGLAAVGIDPTNEFAYFASGDSPLELFRVDVDHPSFAVADALALNVGEWSYYAAVRDPVGEFAYVATSNTPAYLLKIDLDTLERVDTITLEPDEGNIESGIIDPAGEFAYFGVGTNPGKVVKIDLDSFTRVDSITLEPGEDFSESSSAIMDPSGEFAYFGSVSGPGKIVRIDLDPFQRVDAIDVEQNFFVAAVDPAGQYGYFATQECCGNGARVAKIDLDSFTYVDTLIMESDEESIRSIAIDSAGQYAYFGTEFSPGKIIKVDLTTFTRVDAITFGSGEESFFSMVIDPSDTAIMAVAAQPSPARVVRVDLAVFEKNETLILTEGDSGVDTNATIIDPDGRHAYFSLGAGIGKIVKIALAPAAGFRLEYGVKTTSCGAVVSWVMVPSSASGEHWEMVDSASVTDGEPTTDNPDVSNLAGNFVPGAVKESDATTARIVLADDRFTEIEYSIQATTDATTGGAYCFRLTDAGSETPLTADLFAEATIVAPGGSPARSVPPGAGPICGNAVCEPGESFGSCASDCLLNPLPPQAPPGSPPQLSLSKGALRADPTPTALNSVRLFGTVRYRITVTNVGGSTAYRTVIRDPLPPQLDYLQNSVRLNGAPQTDAADGDTTTYNPVARELRLSLPPIPPGESRVFTFDTKPVRTIDGSIIRNKVFANYSDVP